MADLVTSLAAAFIGGVYGRMWLGPVGFVGVVGIGLSLGVLYPRYEEPEELEAGRRRRPPRRRTAVTGPGTTRAAGAVAGPETPL